MICGSLSEVPSARIPRRIILLLTLAIAPVIIDIPLMLAVSEVVTTPKLCTKFLETSCVPEAGPANTIPAT